MNLQKHFSLNRFYKYLKYDLVLNGKTYLFSFIGLILVLICLQFFMVSTAHYLSDFKTQYYTPIFFLTLISGIIISVGTSFPSLRTSQKSINYLLLPASNLEKVMVQGFFRIIVFIVLFIPLYWMSFKLSYGIYGLFEWDNFLEVAPIGLFDFSEKKLLVLDVCAIIFSIISLASFLFVGAVYFKKYAVFKTILAFGILVFMWFLLMVLFSHIFYPSSSRDFFRIHFDDYKINKGLEGSQLLAYIFGIASSLFLLPLAYFKFKEKEV
jgi:hypothetical protein